MRGQYENIYGNEYDELWVLFDSTYMITVQNQISAQTLSNVVVFLFFSYGLHCIYKINKILLYC